MANNKEKIIGVRINKDMLIILQAFKQANGDNFSKTIRKAIKHYCNFIIEKEKNVEQLNNNSAQVGQ